jgi:hypothetical protein
MEVDAALSARVAVSIRALAWRATFKLAPFLAKTAFQSALSRGERPARSVWGPGLAGFQSALSRGERLQS